MPGRVRFVILRNNVTKNLSLNDRKARFFTAFRMTIQSRFVILGNKVFCHPRGAEGDEGSRLA